MRAGGFGPGFSGGDSRYGYLMGVNEDYFPVMNLKASAGSFFTAAEVNRRAKIAVLGGLLGLLLAGAAVAVVRPFFPVSLNLLAVIVSLSVSSAIGVFFGVFPARRAARLSPLEAIRYE